MNRTTLLAMTLLLAVSCKPISGPGEHARIELDSDGIELLMGDTTWLIATVYGPDGRRVAAPDIRWRVTEPTAVEAMPQRFFHEHAVDADAAGARVRAMGLGERWVIAEGYGGADSVHVRVRGHRVTLQSVVAGAAVVCGLTGDGAAYCWGRPEYPLGKGASYPGPTRAPAPVGGGVRFAKLALGHQHVCGLTHAGEAYCWGLNIHGPLGTADPNSAFTPAPVAGGHRFVDLAAGEVHTCGVTEDGVLYCWGTNSYGQLGTDRQAPDTCYGSPCARTPMRVASELNFRHVSAYAFSSCALTHEGRAHCWGLNHEQQLGHESADLCFHGGVGGGYPCSHTPRPVVDAPELVSLAVGGRHTCGLAADGRGFCWGHAGMGELGTGSTENSMTPIPIAGGHRFEQLEQFCGLTLDGRALCWGPNRFWANGTEDYEICPEGAPCNLAPVPVSGGLTFRSITRATRNACGVTEDGVYCWGENYALLGNGYWEPLRSSVPVRVYDGR